MSKPLLTLTNAGFFKKLIKFHGLNIINDGPGEQQFYIEHFQDHNYLIDMNRFFSAGAGGDLMDRSGTLVLPFNYRQPKPWTVPDFNNIGRLDDILYQRVQHLVQLAQGQRINLFWSGGIDSTLVVTAFLKYAADLKQLRVVYSPMSMKENPHFFLMMTANQELELHDYSGENYLQDLDGMSVTGDVSDEITASLDESFYEKFGDALSYPWDSVFEHHGLSSELIDFARQWFATSGMEIKTLLQARWWFYICTKYHLYDAKANIASTSVSFFDMTELEHFVAANLDKLVGDGYNTYKQFFKDFIFEYDKNKNYNKAKTKTNSFQVTHYRKKRLYLQDNRYIAILSDGSRIATPNLPLLSEQEYRAKYGNSLDYLFNKRALAKILFHR